MPRPRRPLAHTRWLGWHLLQSFRSRAMRIFDGPDEVHLRSIAKNELRRTPA